MLSPPYKRSRSLRGTPKMVNKASAAIIKPSAIPCAAFGAHVTATAVGALRCSRHGRAASPRLSLHALGVEHPP
jgi:hypothetical protein